MYQQAISKIESALSNLGVNPADAKTAEGQYSISKNKETEILIDVWQQNELVFFQVMSLITKVQNSNAEAVYKMLLEENHNLVEASFAIINEMIMVKETYEFNSLFTQERAISAINRLAYYSEMYRVKWAL